MAGTWDRGTDRDDAVLQLAEGDDDELWNIARRRFLERAVPKHKKEQELLEAFVQKSESVRTTQQLCRSIQDQADQKYTTRDIKFRGKTILPGDWLRQTFSTIETFIKIGDVAFKGSAETLSLGWTAVKWVLEAVKADEERCEEWAQACEMIAKILLTCQTLGGIFAKARHTEHTKIVLQLLDEIPQAYEAILDYSWAARIQLKHHGFHRTFSAAFPLFSSSVAATASAFAQIKQYSDQIQNDGQTAFAELTTSALDSLGEGQQQMKTDLLNIQGQWDRQHEETRKLLDRLGDLTNEVMKFQRKTPYQTELDRFDEYKRELRPTESSQRFMDHKLGLRSPNTCDWIFEVEEYKQWQSATNFCILRLSGESGTGKSVVTSMIIQKMLESYQNANEAIVLFYYCLSTGNLGGPTTAGRAIHELVYHLYEHTRSDEDLLAQANRAFVKKEGRGRRAPVEDNSDRGSTNSNVRWPPMHEILISLLRVLDRDVYIVVDALDECDQESLEELGKFFSVCAAEETPKVKVFVSSRPEHHVNMHLGNHPVINLKQHNRRDIARHIDDAMTSLSLTSIERTKVRAVLVDRADGQFTYSNLALDILRQPWKRPIETVLEKFQNGVDRLYQDILQKVDPSYEDLAKTLLTWTLLKKGDLSVENFFDIYSQRYVATELATDTDENFAENTQKADANRVLSLYIDQVKKAAGNFVRVTGQGLLQVQHKNVRECFVRSKDPKYHAEDAYYVPEEDGHLSITLELLKNLNSDQFCRDYLLLATQESEGIRQGAEKTSDWSMWNTSNFLDRVTEASSDAVNSRQEDFEDNNTMDPTVFELDTVQQIGATNGTTPFVDNIPVILGELDGNEVNEETRGAPDENNVAVTTTDDAVFVEYDEYDSQDDHESVTEEDTPASNLSPQEHEAGSRYEIWYWPLHLKLAEKAAGVNSTKSGGLWEEVWHQLRLFLLDTTKYRLWLSNIANNDNDAFPITRALKYAEPTPFHVAAMMGLTWVIQRMSEEGATFQAIDRHNYLPIHYLSLNPTLNEDENLLQLLMRYNKVQWYDIEGGSSIDGFHNILRADPTKAILDIMLEQNPKCSIVSRRGRNALHVAAIASSRPEIVRELIDRNVDVNQPDSDGLSPLHYLLRRSDINYYDILDMFLNAGADLNIESRDSEQPVVGAVASGDLRAVQKLVENSIGAKRADINDEDNEGATVLHVAARFGRVEILAYLLRKGAEVNKKNKRGVTVFHSACTHREEKAARYLLGILLAHNMPPGEINFVAQNGKTPLRRACVNGHVETVKSLLELPGLEESINRVDTIRGRTCLHVAAQKGQELTVKLLLNRKAEVLKDNGDKTPLQLCYESWTATSANGSSNAKIKQRYEATSLLLIKNDIYRALEDKGLFFAVASVGSTRIAELLLREGVDPNITDDHDWRPIQHAKNSGHTKVVDLINRSGTSGLPPKRLITEGIEDVVTADSSEHNLYFHDDTRAIISALADHPVREGDNNFYFEVTIVQAKSTRSTSVVIGLTTLPHKLRHWAPGWRQKGVSSYAYHGDDGHLFANNFRGSNRNWPKFGVGQTVGCGINMEDKNIYFTLDGGMLGHPFPEANGRLFPVVGLMGGTGIRVNFGDTDFIYQQNRTLGQKMEASV